MEYYALVLEENGKTHIMRDMNGRLFVYNRKSEAIIKRTELVGCGIMVAEVMVKKVWVEI